LVVEDEPLVAVEVEKALHKAGARVLSAGYVESGLFTTEHPELAGAVVDFRLGTGNSEAVCRRLQQLNVPFVVHTGYPADLSTSLWPDVPVITKPAKTSQIVEALAAVMK
jgi:ActR/RegA family two-component response regulator